MMELNCKLNFPKKHVELIESYPLALTYMTGDYACVSFYFDMQVE